MRRVRSYIVAAMLVAVVPGCHSGTSLQADGIPQVSELQSAIWVHTSSSQSDSYQIVVTRSADACTRYQTFVERCTVLMAEFSSQQSCEDPKILEPFAELYEEFTATESLRLHLRVTELVASPGGGPSTFSADWFHDVGNSFSCSLSSADGENPFRLARQVWDPQQCKPGTSIDDGWSSISSLGEGRLTMERMGDEALHGTLAVTLHDDEMKDPQVVGGAFDAVGCDLTAQDSGHELCVQLALGSSFLLYLHPSTLDDATE